MFKICTRILLSNGNFKAVEHLVLEERVNGGSLIEICWGLSDHDWYLFNGVAVAGVQEAWFDGDWMAIGDIPGAQKTAPAPRFCSLKTTTGRVFGINDTTFRAE